MQNLAIILLVLIIQGCGAIKYVPEEYPINNDRIEDFYVVGSVKVINIQKDNSEFTFITGDRPWLGSLEEVTELLKMQLSKEINENSTAFSSGNSKTIMVKVINLEASYEQTLRPFLPLDFISEITLEFELGNGIKERLVVPNKAPSNYNKVLNGAVALGVIEILKNQDVISYLEKKIIE